MGMSTSSDRPRIGILLDHIESAYHVELVEAAVRTAHRRGARVVILPGGALTESGTPGRPRGFLYDFLRSAELDGLLILGGTLSNYCGVAPFDHWVRTLPKTPTIVVGISTPSAPSVVVDNHLGVQSLIDHLIEKHGRRHIAFVAGPAESYEAEERKGAYLAALANHGIDLGDRYIVPGGLGREQGIDAVVHLLEDRRLTAATLDAIVTVNDDVALGVLEELHRRKIHVPEQLSVAGFDDAPSARSASPPLTTVSQRVYEQGATAMARLVDAATGQTSMDNEAIRPSLVRRDSCGCHPQMESDTSNSDGPDSEGQSGRLLLSERIDSIALKLTRVAQGRLRGGQGWERRLVDGIITHLTTGKAILPREFEYLARKTGETGIEVCHEVLTELRREALTASQADQEARQRMEDLFQESRLAISNVALFTEREHQAMQAMHLRDITRSCLDRAHGAGLPELAVTLEEQLPLLDVRTFVIAQGDGDELRVIARGSRRSGHTPLPVVTTSRLGMDDALEQEETVVVLPLSARGHQVGLAAMSWGQADPYLFEKLRDLLGMALGLP